LRDGLAHPSLCLALLLGGLPLRGPALSGGFRDTGAALRCQIAFLLAFWGRRSVRLHLWRSAGLPFRHSDRRSGRKERASLFERRDLRINECNNLFQSHAGIISLRSRAAPGQVFSPTPRTVRLCKIRSRAQRASQSEWGRSGVSFPLGWVAEDAARPERGRERPPNKAGNSFGEGIDVSDWISWNSTKGRARFEASVN